MHPDTYGGTHFQELFVGNSGPHLLGEISNHWFYLLNEGSGGVQTNDLGWQFNVLGIGHENAAKIVFRTMTEHLVSSSNFMNFRQASLLATQELINEGQINLPDPTIAYKSVMDAWHGVGVGGSYDDQKFYSPFDGEVNINPWTTRLAAEVTYGIFEKAWVFEVSTDPNFSNDAKERYRSGNITQSTVDQAGRTIAQALFNLDPNKTYYWRMQTSLYDQAACNNYAESLGQKPGSIDDFCGGLTKIWSKTNIFSTDTRAVELPPPPAEVYPWDGKFTFAPTEGALGYIFQLSTTKFPDLEERPSLVTEEATAGDEHYLNLFVEQQYQQVNGQNSDALLYPQKFMRTLRVGRNYQIRALAVGPQAGWVEDPNAPPANVYLTEPAFGPWTNNGDPYLFKTAIPKTHVLTPDGNTSSAVSPWKILFTWEKLQGALPNYSFQAGDQPFFTKDNGSIPLSQIAFTNPEDFTLSVSFSKNYDQQVLYGRLIPHGPAPFNESGTSDEIPFKIDYELTKPTLIKPVNDEEIPFHSPVDFEASQIAEADGYVFHVSKGPVYGINGPGTEYPSVSNTVSLTNVSDDKIDGYCWKASTVGPITTSGHQLMGIVSDESCYTIGPAIPLTLTPQEKSSPYYEKNFAFTWQDEYAPNGFIFRLLKEKSDGTCCDTIKNNVDIGLATPLGNNTYQYVLTNEIEQNAHYYWRVGAKKNNGEIAWYPALVNGVKANEFITRPNLVPPSIDQVYVGIHSIEVTWSDANKNGLFSRKLDYFPAEDPSTITTVDVPNDENPYMIAGLDSGTEYTLIMSDVFINPLTFLDGTPGQNSSQVSAPFSITTQQQQNIPHGSTNVSVYFPSCSCTLIPKFVDADGVEHDLIDLDVANASDTFYPGDTNNIVIGYMGSDVGKTWKIRLKIADVPAEFDYPIDEDQWVTVYFTQPDGTQISNTIDYVDFENNYSFDFVFTVPSL